MAFGGISFDDVAACLPKGHYRFSISDTGEFTASKQNDGTDGRPNLPGLGDKVFLTLKVEVSEDNEDPEYRGTPVRDVFLTTYPKSKPFIELSEEEKREARTAINEYRKIMVSLGIEDSHAALSKVNVEEFVGTVEFFAKTYQKETDENSGMFEAYVDTKTIKAVSSVEVNELVEFE